MAEEQVKQETNEKNSLKCSPKCKFWIRFALWVLFALIIPVAFIVWRFELFSPESKATFGVWGLIVIFIVMSFTSSLLKYIKKGLPFSMVTQIIRGLCKTTLPLVMVLLLVYCIKNNAAIFIQAMGCVLVSETIAIPIDPMPKWIYENCKEEHNKNFESMTDVLWDKFFSRKGEK